MSRYIYVGFNTSGTTLLTVPDDYSKPERWSDELLASARGEINYRLTEPRIDAVAILRLEELRKAIEIEMRKRLNVPESPEEYKARCLFHASEINYRTGDRDTRKIHIR